MNKILETSFNGQLILKKNYPECVSLVFWKKLQLNYFVSRSTDLQDLPANQHSQSSPISQIMAGLAVLHSWQILKGSLQCTTLTRFWYQEPKLKSKILSSETETFSFNKFFSCFPLLSWGYEFLEVGMSKMASTLCSNFSHLFLTVQKVCVRMHFFLNSLHSPKNAPTYIRARTYITYLCRLLPDLIVSLCYGYLNISYPLIH